MVFMPHISEWWETVSDTVKSTFLTLLQDVPSFSPVLIFATAETHYSQLSDEVRTQCTHSPELRFLDLTLDLPRVFLRLYIGFDAISSIISDWAVLTWCHLM